MVWLLALLLDALGGDEVFKLLYDLRERCRGVDLDGGSGAQPGLDLGEILQDERSLAGCFP